MTGVDGMGTCLLEDGPFPLEDRAMQLAPSTGQATHAHPRPAVVWGRRGPRVPALPGVGSRGKAERPWSATASPSVREVLSQRPFSSSRLQGTWGRSRGRGQCVAVWEPGQHFSRGRSSVYKAARRIWEPFGVTGAAAGVANAGQRGLVQACRVPWNKLKSLDQIPASRSDLQNSGMRQWCLRKDGFSAPK